MCVRERERERDQWSHAGIASPFLLTSPWLLPPSHISYSLHVLRTKSASLLQVAVLICAAHTHTLSFSLFHTHSHSVTRASCWCSILEELVLQRSDEKSYQNISEASFSYREEEELTQKIRIRRIFNGDSCFQVSFLQLFFSFCLHILTRPFQLWPLNYVTYTFYKLAIAHVY